MDLAVQAGPEAGMYALASATGREAYLSWLEPTASGLALRFASLEGDRWGTPRTIVQGRHLFSNWADHPSIAAHADGTLVAQWPVINDGPQPPGSYNNSMRIAVSRDRGRTWSEAFADGLDNVHSYTGFVSLLPMPSGWRAVYLSPPRLVSHDPLDHGMTLSHVALDRAGTRRDAGVIDGDTCSCCPTTVGLTAAGPIAAYRDHEAGEIRDIAVVRWVEGRWTSPRRVHRDGWKINGCPTNGPAMATVGGRVALAWFTAASNTPRVRLAFSADSGATFTAPVDVDGAQSVGRPAVTMLADGSAVVAWLASLRDGTGSGQLRLRRVFPDGRLGSISVVGAASPGRASGMPQLVRVGESVIVAWRAERLRTVRLAVPQT